MATTRVYRKLDAATDQVALSADTTLNHSHSGKTILLDATGEQITLPAVSAGLNFRFVCSVAVTGSNWTIINGADVMYGSAMVASTVVACSQKDIVTLVADKFLPGDFVTLESDGTNWYVYGAAVTTAGITFTT